MREKERGRKSPETKGNAMKEGRKEGEKDTEGKEG